MNYIGIDPGQKGGLALLLDRKIVEYTLMPPTVRGIVEWIYDRSIQAGGELTMVAESAQAMPKQGVTAVFTYGRHFGTFEAIAACFSIRYEEVRPAAWKKKMGLNAKKMTSNKLCEQLFPNVQLIPPGCRVPKDGISEACLIAEYARRMGM